MNVKESLFTKIMAFGLLLVTATACWSLVMILVFMTDTVEVYKSDFTETAKWEELIHSDASLVYQYYTLKEKDTLTEDEQTWLDNMEGALYPPAGTNAVWVLVDTNGRLLLSNLAEAASGPPVNIVVNKSGGHYEQIQYDGFFIVIGMHADMPAADQYTAAKQQFDLAKYWITLTTSGTVISFIITIFLFSYLVTAAGHTLDSKAIKLNVLDYIWVEPFFGVIAIGLYLISVATFNESLDRIGRVMVMLTAISISMVTLLSIVRRAKAGMLFKTSFTYSFLHLIRTILRNVKLLIRVIAALLMYCLVQLFLVLQIINGNSIAVLFWLLFNGGTCVFVTLVCIQYDNIRKASDRIAAGELGPIIDQNRVPLFYRLASNLNSINGVITQSVSQATQSERMKTELIANVSHDIKTPLTSIISYVDLLKTTAISDPHALEYIDILDKKSRRLAQLMADLLEASKVTTGNVSVNREQFDLVELVKQAGGEFESRFEERGIHLVSTLPDQPMLVYADGRHMWRVMDNLFSNAAKYALDGTRVYVGIEESEHYIHLTMKNVSRDALNMSPNELMERFVRGDKSRYTEGSGLGLSIARSLMELQNGSLDISIDGDLFKVQLALPRIPRELTPLPVKVGETVQDNPS